MMILYFQALLPGRKSNLSRNAAVLPIDRAMTYSDCLETLPLLIRAAEFLSVYLHHFALILLSCEFVNLLSVHLSQC